VAAVAALPPLRPTFGQTAPADEGPGATDLQRDLEEAIARHRVAGASAAVYHRGEIETATAGILNATTGVEVTPDTVMHIGSITKTLNTTLVGCSGTVGTT